MIDFLLTISLILFLFSTSIAAFKRFAYRETRSNQNFEADAPPIKAIAPHNNPRILIGYASQSGLSQSLATRTAENLATAGFTARLEALDEIAANDLATSDIAIFLVSTSGEGDAPRNAHRFKKTVIRSKANLQTLRYSLICFGDKTYSNYCGFGIDIYQWLKRSKATPIHTPVLVDNSDDYSINQWKGYINELFPSISRTDQTLPKDQYTRWRLEDRVILNPSSPFGRLFRLKLSPVDSFVVDWSPCDIAVVYANTFNEVMSDRSNPKPREYTISSSTRDGSIDLFVRLLKTDSGYGKCSYFLTNEAQINDSIALSIRKNPILSLIDSTAPAILIGSGSGVAGVIGQIKTRLSYKSYKTWVIYGERCPNDDNFLSDQFMHWYQNQQIQRYDIVFSKDSEKPEYVQDILVRDSDELREWLSFGAYIYVCGSHDRLGKSTEASLKSILGQVETESLMENGRILFDTY